MGGGPSTIYGPRAYAAFCEFAPEPVAAWPDPTLGEADGSGVDVDGG